MRNPTNSRNEPVCPFCARVFGIGETVLRTRDTGYLVHPGCAEECEDGGDQEVEIA